MKGRLYDIVWDDGWGFRGVGSGIFGWFARCLYTPAHLLDFLSMVKGQACLSFVSVPFSFDYFYFPCCFGMVFNPLLFLVLCWVHTSHEHILCVCTKDETTRAAMLCAMCGSLYTEASSFECRRLNLIDVERERRRKRRGGAESYIYKT